MIIDLSPELVKFYRSASGDPEDRVTNVRKVRRHYDFIVIGDAAVEEWHDTIHIQLIQYLILRFE